jgi:hypothetical protein
VRPGIIVLALELLLRLLTSLTTPDNPPQALVFSAYYATPVFGVKHFLEIALDI